MHSRREPLTKRERAELQGYVSRAAAVGRGVLFIAAVALVAALCRGIQHWFSLQQPFWVLPSVAFAAFLYYRSRRWTGGRELQRSVLLDLKEGSALVHSVRVQDAIKFEEREDEGPIIFVLCDTGETLAFLGQDISRHATRGFPWREFEIRETPNSRRLLGLTRRGDPFPLSATKPPLPSEQFRLLGLSYSTWQHVSVPFHHVQVA